MERGRGRGRTYERHFSNHGIHGGARGSYIQRGRSRSDSYQRHPHRIPAQGNSRHRYPSSQARARANVSNEDIPSSSTAVQSCCRYGPNTQRYYSATGRRRNDFNNSASASSRTSKPISYARLQEMERSYSPLEITIALARSTSGLEERLRVERSNLRTDMTEMLLKVFVKMKESTGATEFLVAVLQLILDHDFDRRVTELVYEMQLGLSPTRRNRLEIFLKNSLQLMNLLLTILPNTSEKNVSICMHTLEKVIDGLGTANDEIENLRDEIKVALDKLEEKRKVKNERASRYCEQGDLHSRPPPDDFREIPICPQFSDIHGNPQPFLRTSLMDRAYKDNEHYLDVQFRLLREDFIRPLREGIKEFTQHRPSDPRRHQNMKVYENVKIEQMIANERGISYRIHFNVDKLRKVRWKNTRRLLFGNLLCLSSDRFQTELIFAVVADRKPETLEEGCLLVQFIHEDKSNGEQDENDADEVHDARRLAVGQDVRRLPRLPQIEMNKIYTMVESEAYFEASRYVLAGLQETKTVPMERYIIHCCEDVHAPEYIRPSHAGTLCYDIPTTMGCDQSVEVLGKKWPSPEQLGLNASQTDALQLALRNELALIQGPPGTGKTYVGLLIMKILLQNKQKWFKPSQSVSVRRKQSAKEQHCPILVVCYTNHALDQFLEGIAQFSSKNRIIVRVGGRCQNEATKKFTLGEIKQGRRGKYGRDIWDLKEKLKRSSENIQNRLSQLEALSQVVFKLKAMKDVIPPHLYQQLDTNAEQIRQFGQASAELRLFKTYLDEHHSRHQKSNNLDEDFLIWLGLYAMIEKNFGQIAMNNLSDESIKLLQKEGRSFEEMGRAFDSIGIDDFEMLNNWIIQTFLPKSQRLGNGENDDMHSSDSSALQDDRMDVEIEEAYKDFLEQTVRQQETFELQDYGMDVEMEEAYEDFSEQIVRQQKTLDQPTREKSKDDVASEQSLEEADLLQQQRIIETGDISSITTEKLELEAIAKRTERVIQQMSAVSIQDTKAEDAPSHGGGWQRTKVEIKKAKQRIKTELRKASFMTDEDEERITDIHSLNQDDRWRLYRTWMKRCRDRFRRKMSSLTEEHDKEARKLEVLKREEDREILQSADVIALTTTGAAKYRDIISGLNCKIVVIEEAAEVLEAHIITAMPSTTKHLILIGDHRQLKPSPTVYELARKYHLDVSLFERLIKKIKHVTLTLQHRMRPEIADLIRPHIYKELGDHPDVLNRGSITGVQKPVFFLSHNIHEESVADGKSKMNQYEANFLRALCKHLILQEYEPKQITILTMYTGQIFAFRKVMERECKSVRVTAVDNFQGEENDIILLSLVRSNDEAKIGFLGIENRICVALSRAKCALYCIGNMELLAEHSSMWQKIVANLHERGSIGDAIMLQCKHHPNKLTPVNCVSDFKKVPEGGCGVPCLARLDCGHVCPKPCHPEDHSKYRCMKPCDRIIPCELKHMCRRRCWQSCEPCPERVPKVMPECGHTQRILCQTAPSDVICVEKIEASLPCGHQARISCYLSKVPTFAMCKESCKEILKCGHLCTGSCYECFQGRMHVPCAKKCGRTLVCGHSCTANCDSCPPCGKPCRTRCGHSKCVKRCGEPCVLCEEICRWECPHFKCTRKCSEPCDRPPCNSSCRKKMKCGHECIGLCGEPCPKLCGTCDKTKVTEIFFGDEGNEEARFVELEDCGHIFTYQSLDEWMTQNEDGNAIKMKECPRCKTTIWQSTRYGNIINKLLKSVNKVKGKMWGSVSEARQCRKNLVKDVNKEVPLDKYGNNVKAKEPYAMQMEGILYQLKARKYFFCLIQFGNFYLFQNCFAPCDIAVIEERFRRMQTLRDLKRAHSNMLRKNKIPKHLAEAINNTLKSMLQWVYLKRHVCRVEREVDNFRDETEKIRDELKYIDVVAKYKRMYDERACLLGHSETVPEFVRLKALLCEAITPYDEERKQEVQRLFREIADKFPQLSSNLEISQQEKKMILKAMDFTKKGHWYSCPNGHVYAIGDCGGATITASCPECKEKIGGSSHALLSTNRVATEMDGATSPAFGHENNDIPRHMIEELRREGFQVE